MISERGRGPNGWGNFPLFVKRNEKRFHVVNLLFSLLNSKRLGNNFLYPEVFWLVLRLVNPGLEHDSIRDSSSINGNGRWRRANENFFTTHWLSKLRCELGKALSMEIEQNAIMNRWREWNVFDSQPYAIFCLSRHAKAAENRNEKESEKSFRWSWRRRLNAEHKKNEIPSIEIPQRTKTQNWSFQKLAYKVAHFYASYANSHEGEIDFHQITKLLASRTRTKMKSSWRFFH